MLFPWQKISPTSLTTTMPLRIRLTLWYSLAFATALFTVAFAALWMVNRAIDDLEQNELQQRVRSVRRFLEARPKNESIDATHAAMAAADDVSHGNKWLQVIDEHGNWLYRSSHVAAAYPQLVLPQNASATDNYFTYKADSIPVRALIAPITVRGVRYTVQTGLTLSKTLVVLSNLRIQLSVLTILGLIVSSLAGYFMSRKALTPIAAIAAEAQRINDKNLSARLPTLHTHDELASLSNTLNQMLGRIDAGYQSVRSFTANAAHELRSPVALLRAESEVALAFPRDADYYRNTCQHVLQSSVQMARLIDQLLALARADAGVDVLKFAPVNLPDLIEEVFEEWHALFAESKIQFHSQRGPTEFWISADYLALKRLLNILVENAWRYTPSGQSVTIALLESSSTDMAEISISDTGIGISEQDQLHIFERFYRVARPLHGESTGSGLGLALGQWIAERHNSGIKLKSVPGEGSCFSFEMVRLQNVGKNSGVSYEVADTEIDYSISALG